MGKRLKGRFRNYGERCRKTGYGDYASAEAEMKTREAMDPRPGANVYWCEWCAGWHWGHTHKELRPVDMRHDRFAVARVLDEELRQLSQPLPDPAE